MKAKYLIVSLALASICFSCSYIGPDREDDLIIITDKGPDLDDDKTHMTPDDKSPTTPGEGDAPIPPGGIPSDSIPSESQPSGKMPQTRLETLYIDDNQVDSTLFVGNGQTIESHIVVQQGGRLEICKQWIMHSDATVTIEDGGVLSVRGILRQLDLTIQAGGTLELVANGAIFLTGRECLHLESGAIIRCTGIQYPEPDDSNGNSVTCDEWNIFAPPADPTSSSLERLDSLEIQQIINQSTL